MPSKSDEPGVADSEARVRRGSEHSRHHRSKKQTADDGRLSKHGDQGKTKSSIDQKGRGKLEAPRPSIWRRATDVVDTSRTRPTVVKKEAARKEAERHPSSRYGYERPIRRHSLPPRNEKRTISETVTRAAKDRQPHTRKAQNHDSKGVKSSSTSRPSLRRSKTTTRKEKPSSEPASPQPERRERAQSFSGSVRKPSSVLGSVMSSSKAKPVKQVECVTCMDELPVTEANYLKHCQHYWCDSCLKRVFDLSVTDIQHMPPKCCGGKPIQPKVALHLYKSDFRKLWNAKFVEWTTKDRLYCPAKSCGTWIKPENIKVDSKGKKVYGKCPKCSKKVCPKCNCKYHPDNSECPDDPATAAFVKTAKENGWQNCGQCGMTIERTEGCYHMTCPPPCNFQFCILCGSKWKTCQCPWLTNDMVGAGVGAAPNQARQFNLNPYLIGLPGGGPVPPPQPQPHPPHRILTYEDEMTQRREQVRQDEALARRLARMNLTDANPWGLIHDFGIPPDTLIHDIPAPIFFRAHRREFNRMGFDEATRVLAQFRRERMPQPMGGDGGATFGPADVAAGPPPPPFPPHAPPAPVRRGLVDGGGRATWLQ